MSSLCEFHFDRSDAVYHSGERVNGKIILTTATVKRVRGVYITLKGFARVRWSERRSRYNSETKQTETYTIQCCGDEQYLHSKTQVEEELDLPPGLHEYFFSSPIPRQAPSSISRKFGQVSYEVEIKLDQFLRNEVFSKSFTVIRPLNLNLDPIFVSPTSSQEENFLCCCCCATGTLKSELCTEYSGYAPGQEINFTILIDNGSNIDIEKCTVELLQNIAFMCQKPEIKVKNVQDSIANVQLSGAKMMTKPLHKGTLLVPPLPTTTMGVSDIISVSYFLRAEIETGSCNANLSFKSNLIIGSVPLNASEIEASSVITVQPTAPALDQDFDSSIPPQYDIDPPSFDEAIRMSTNPIQDRLVSRSLGGHTFATPSARDNEGIRFISDSQRTLWQSPSAIPGAPRPI